MSSASGSGPTPLLRLREVSRIYASGEQEVRALDGVTLDIHAGEFIAIVGQSGSGKSTLMNVIGCLDRASAGSYAVRGTEVAELDADQLAELRRDTFGFVFQRYNLLGTATAAENVELPAIYAGRPRRERLEQAGVLLARLGLSDRATHRPSQLSGGQQQRVSIARALMNGPEVILADEPTGALDSESGKEVLALLAALNAEGNTVILITHDAAVAAHAERTIQMLDGRIVDDTGRRQGPRGAVREVPTRRPARALTEIAEAVKMAFRSLRTNLFRSALTLLGVVIGVASVVTMLAIGNGSKQDVVERIEAMGSNLLLVYPGAPGARRGGDTLTTLTADDARALAELDDVENVSPERRDRATLRFGSRDYKTNVTGVWPGYVDIQDWRVTDGSFFNEADLRGYAAVVVLGQTVVDNLFPGESPLGRYVLLGNVPFEVIGVLAPKGANAFGRDLDDTALVPLSTGLVRVFGKQYVSSVNLKVSSAEATDRVRAAIDELLLARHGEEDFRVRSTASLMEAVSATQDTLTWLLGAVAAISLLVGGIGVMNIMLVNVTERTREIGVRMATGARRANILLQFNTEALVVCGIGGVVGVALGMGAGFAVDLLGTRVVFTTAPALLAFGSAFATGLVFGYLPARKAAHMDPVTALASE